jgi:hypothetical protein
MQNKGIQESVYLRKGIKSQMLKKQLKQPREMGKEISKDTKFKGNQHTEVNSQQCENTKKQENKLEELGITKVKNQYDAKHHEEQTKHQK